MKDFPSLGKMQSSRLVRKAPFTNRRSSMRLAVAWVILFLVAGFFVRQRVEYLRSERRIRSLMEQKQKLIADILPLKLEESHLTRMARIEGLATQMGLAPAAEWQKFYLQLPASQTELKQTLEEAPAAPQAAQPATEE